MNTTSAADGAAIYFKAILLNLVVQLLGGVIIIAVTDNSSATNTVSVLLSLFIQVGFFLAVYPHLKSRKISLYYRVSRVKWYVGAIAFFAAPLCILCFILPAQAFVQVLERIGYTFSETVSVSRPFDYAVFAFSAVLVAPLVEEVVFRGALLGGLVRKMGAIPAILISGLAFSLMHMNPEQTVYQFFLGCCCAAFTIGSRSVLPAIIMHAGNNLVALLLDFLPASETPSTAGIGFILGMGAVLALIGIAAFYAISRFFFKHSVPSSGGRIFAFKKPVSPETPETTPEKTEIAAPEIAPEATSTAPQKPNRKPLFYAAIESARVEQRRYDEEIDSGLRRPPLLGKRTHTILLSFGGVICLAMWLMVFFVGLA